MDLEKIYIVLDRPQENRNIGAVCRAMANSDIQHLRIVGKKEDYDDKSIKTLAIHASYIWDKAEFYSSIKEATADCVLSAGTTRRSGKKRKGKLLFPEELAKLATDVTGEKGQDGGAVSVVFGNERTGLTDEELFECTVGATIPSSNSFSSLNLSYAVQIICYQFFRETKKNFKGYTPIALGQLDGTIDIITDNLQRIGFFSVTGKSSMKMFWRSILSRAALSEGEAAYLEKTFAKISGILQRKKGL